MTAQDERGDVLDRDGQLARDECPEARRVEEAGHADHPLGREAGLLPRQLHHRVERVRHENQDRVLRAPDDLLDDAPDDLRVLEEQVVAGHPRLPGEARGDHDDVRVRGLIVAVGPGQPRVVAVDRSCLGEVERLALRHALDDVHKHDVAQLLLDHVLRHGGADVSGADDGDLGARSHQSLAMS